MTIVGFDLTLIVVGIIKLLGWFQILKDSFIPKQANVEPARNDEIVTSNPPNKHLVALIRFAMSTLDKAIKVFGLYFQINIENIRILDLKFNVKGSQIQQIKLKTLSIPSVRISQQASNYHIDIPAIKATQELYVYVLKVMDYFGNPYDQQNVIQEIHIEKRSGSSFLSELLKSPVYVTVNIGKIRLVIDQIKITMSLVTTIELMEEYHQTRGKIQIETKCGELLVIDDFESSRNGRSSSLQMSMDCELNFSLQHFVSILSSFMPFIEQQKMRKPTKNAIKTDPLMLLATIPRFVLNLELPNQICTTTVFDSLKITNDFEGNWIVNAGQIRTEFPITGGGLFDSGERIHSFLELLDFRLLAILEKDDMPTQLQFSLHQSKVVVPNAWPMYNIVENGICLQKAIKSMILDALEKSPRDFSSGKTFSKLSWFPVISLSSNLVEVLFEDDPFEVKLARNYKVGYLQNLQRLEREKAFASKLGEIDTNNRKSYLMKSPGNESSKQDLISVAWRLMQRKGCAEYIQAIRLASARPEPPLLHAKITDMKLFVCSTVSEKDPIEVLLNQIDSSTLADAIYDDLLPLNYSGTLCGLEVRLRDYSNPLLLIDPSIATICETKGSLIIAEPKTAADSYRYVILPIGEDQSILVRRNINPAKFYFDVTSIIDSNHSSYLCVGAAFEGALNDVINIIDDFTAVTEDPSPPLGWWDKVRFIYLASSRSSR